MGKDQVTKRYYLDTEFSDFNGWLISLALVCDDGRHLYLVRPEVEIAAENAVRPMNEWVAENVMPILRSVPDGAAILDDIGLAEWGFMISNFFSGTDFFGSEAHVQIIADWPEDHRYLIDLLLTGPGESVPMGRQTDLTVLRHIKVYPTDLPGAVQHNALWDAMAIKHFVDSQK